LGVYKVVFVHPNERREEFTAEAGESLMRIATNNLVDGIIGECGGELSCATCHVFVDLEWVDRLPPRASDEELMLEVTAEEADETSRLCCQIKAGPETDGILVRIPKAQT
jgi:2Fe-2S ferredoxin